ncbi:protein of unknown function [Halomonas saccharevitans]|uniref:DUF4376 domain-containing protein n=2 Tax=Halomonas saccharevitans TaxID=416872 RepID=A0A1I7CQ40_9GAMM|nr:protein of unknown function [Halomonas saccharevitans]
MYAKWMEGDQRFAFSPTDNGGVSITKTHHRELLTAESQGKLLRPDESGVPITADRPPPTIEELAEQKRQEIATALADALAAGMPYTMPDGSEDTVQMLAEDRQNLLGLAIEARDLKAAGVTDPVQEFRGLSNTRYPMTPDQVIALTDAALSHYKVLLQQSWDRKDVIDAALAAEDRDKIEAVVW